MTTTLAPTVPARSRLVPRALTGVVAAKVEALNARAEKLGTGAVTVTFSDEVTWLSDPDHPDRKVPHVTATVTGESPRLDDAHFVALVDHQSPEHGAPNVVHFAPAVDTETRARALAAYREAPSACDHCGLDRQRNNTYVVAHGQLLLQVGSTCVKDFVGWDPGTALNAYFVSEDPLDDEGWGSWSGSYSLGRDDFLARTAAAVRLFGWTSKAKSTATHPPTVEDVVGSYGRLDRDNPLTEVRDYTADDEATAQAALAWVQASTETSDYLLNLQAALAPEWLSERSYGLAASAVGVFLSHQAKEAEREAQAATGAASTHVGAVGERAEFTVTVASVRSFEGNYGTTGLHVLVTPEGNRLKWWASGSATWLEPGETYRVKATVKDHEEFNGVAETKVNRVTVLEALNPEVPCGDLTAHANWQCNCPRDDA